MPKTAPQTLYDKIFEDHVVSSQPDGTCILYIDRHLVHEVTSPQAFEGLRLAGRKVRAPEKTLAVVDHNIATTADRNQGIKDEESRIQVETMAKNAKDFGIEYYDERDVRQGIVHVIGPEQGFTLPGTTIVCGDSHTSTHGAFGALAFGIGTSEVEHVLATQTLPQRKPKAMEVRVEGELPLGVSAKDIILNIIGRIGIGGGQGHVIDMRERHQEPVDGRPHDGVQHEYRRRRPRGHDRPGRHDLCLPEGRERAQRGRLGQALDAWRSSRPTRRDVARTVEIDAAALVPHRDLGHLPGEVAPINGRVPDRRAPVRTTIGTRSSKLAYMDLQPSMAIRISPWIGCSSVRAPMPASRTCARRPRSFPATISIRGCGPWSCLARTRSRWPPSSRAWTGCSPTLASNGARRAAACAWA